MARQTKENALATRERLLDAAETLFLARGVSGTSLQDIAETAQLTRGAVYWHFTDKAALFSAMMDRGSLPCEEALRRSSGNDPSAALHNLRELALAPLRRMAEDAHSQRLFVIAMHRTEYSDELAPLRERYHRCTQDYVSRLEHLLAQASKARQIRPGVVARAAAVGLHALVDGLLRYATQNLDNAAELRHATQAVDNYLAGLSCNPPVAGSAEKARPPRRKVTP